MKIIKISDNIKINIEMIYSLERHNNDNDINAWENDYKLYLEKFTKDPPMLPITDSEVYRPIYGEKIDEEKMKLYRDALKDHIIAIIGNCPEYTETYFILLCTGLKIHIDKTIYNAVDKYLEKYIDKD